MVHLARQREPGRGRRRWRGCSPTRAHYVDTYDPHGLVGPRSVLAHNVHPDRRASSRVLAARGASVAHCPTSNSALGSGLFPLRRHVAARGARGARLRRRRRHRLLAVQGGAAGLLPPALLGAEGCRSPPPTCSTSAPARARRARPRRQGRGPVGRARSSTRSGCGRLPDGPSTSASGTPTRRGRAGQGLRPRRRRRRRRACGSAATGSRSPTIGGSSVRPVSRPRASRTSYAGRVRKSGKSSSSAHSSNSRRASRGVERSPTRRGRRAPRTRSARPGRA